MSSEGTTSMMVYAGALLIGAGLYIMIGLPAALIGGFFTWLALKG